MEVVYHTIDFLSVLFLFADGLLTVNFRNVDGDRDKVLSDRLVKACYDIINAVESKGTTEGETRSLNCALDAIGKGFTF